MKLYRIKTNELTFDEVKKMMDFYGFIRVTYPTVEIGTYTWVYKSDLELLDRI
jgi:hypothetical protein